MTDMKKALADVAEVFKFEQWLRFYFITEKNDKLFIEIPEERVKKIEKEYEHLFPLVEMVNNRETSQEISTEVVCGFVASRLDGRKYPEGTVGHIFDGKPFKLEMYMFNLWIQAQEGYLDQEFRDFREWEKLYGEWRQTDQVKEYYAKLTMSAAGSARTQ